MVYQEVLYTQTLKLQTRKDVKVRSINVSDPAARPLSTIADNFSALPSPTPSPCSVSNSSCLIPSMPAPVCQPLPWTTVLFMVLHCEIENVYLVFAFCAFFVRKVLYT